MLPNYQDRRLSAQPLEQFVGIIASSLTTTALIAAFEMVHESIDVGKRIVTELEGDPGGRQAQQTQLPLRFGRQRYDELP